MSISRELATLLKAAAKGRPSNAPLLTRAGEACGEQRHSVSEALIGSVRVPMGQLSSMCSRSVSVNAVRYVGSKAAMSWSRI